MNRRYIAIDLKSFYASVECVERGLDPMKTNLVVADESRTEKTICLAVSPSLKAYGIPGRCRLFEVVQKIRAVNAVRRRQAGGKFVGESNNADELSSVSLQLSYIVAKPRMAFYIDYSTRIYNIYLSYVAPEDIHVYSIDEVFIDVTDYLAAYKLTAAELARKMIHDVFDKTGITATAGVGTNLYLAKVAMDILAKRAEADRYGVRLAELDEQSYRRLLWEHRPLTDFWRIGRGYAKKLEACGMYTMGDIARASLIHEQRLYKLFGINAELLIDHAWGFESCTIADIKAFKPSSNSFSTGQVLACPYPFEKAKLIVREMSEELALRLLEKNLVTDQLMLYIGYVASSLSDDNAKKEYSGAVTTDFYGRSVPKYAHGTTNLSRQCASSMLITKAIMELYERIVNPKLSIRRITLGANRIVDAGTLAKAPQIQQLSFFTDVQAEAASREAEEAALEREARMQSAILDIKRRYGRNAILKGISLEEGARAKERNEQIGGHKA